MGWFYSLLNWGNGYFILFSMSFMVVHKRWRSEVTYANCITLRITARLPEVLVHEHMVNAIVISATGESPRGMVPMVPVIMRLFILQKWIMSFLLLWFISPDPWALIIPTQLRFGSPPIAFMSLHAYNKHVMLFKAPYKWTHYCWMLHVASTCTPCWMLSAVLASVCTPLQHWCNNMQHCWHNNVGSSCVHLHVA